MPSLVVIQVFAGHIVFGHFTSVNFPSVLAVGLFNSRNHASFERVSLFDQLVNAFRIGAFDVGQALKISRFLARAWFPVPPRENDGALRPGRFFGTAPLRALAVFPLAAFFTPFFLPAALDRMELFFARFLRVFLVCARFFVRATFPRVLFFGFVDFFLAFFLVAIFAV